MTDKPGVQSLILVLLVLAAALCTMPAAAQPRVALVIGVSAYRAVPALPNPVNDARDLAAALGRLGFETEMVLDPDRPAMEAAIRRFGVRARGADAALFFFAGHALEANGRNWLLPTTADIASDRDLRFEALDAETVLEQVESAARVTIVLLDACRDNPFRTRLGAGSRAVGGAQGLAPVRAAVGTLIGYATAPGTVAEDGRGRNSPFTTGLLRHIETPGLEVRQVMAEVRREVRESTRGRQVPWEASSLEGAFYFKPPAPAAAPTAAPRAAAADPDALFWDSVRASRDPADFRAYLARFPNGIFAELARNRLAQLGGPAQAAVAPPQQPTVPRPEQQASAAARALPLTAERLAAAMPFVPPAVASELAGRYVAENGRKALAVNPDRRSPWRTSGHREGEPVEELVLERCQVFYRTPCLVVALDGKLLEPPPGGSLPRRDMPRVSQGGAFDPARIPTLTASARREASLRSYGAAPGPKAVALHPHGRAFPVTGAASQHEAEERALRACNEDPQRKGRDGPCLLYASGDQVVLQQWRTTPAAPAVATPPPARTPAPPGAPLTVEALAAAIPYLSRVSAQTTAEGYLAAPLNRVLAVNPERRLSHRGNTYGQTDGIEDAVLELCQLIHGSPCIAVAVNDELRGPAPNGGWARRDLPRLSYSGPYDPAQVPGISAFQRRTTQAIRDYGTAPLPKAMAVGPWGRVTVETGAADQHEAERRALQACNDDPRRAGQSGPCYLVASGNRMVLPERRTGAVPAPAAAR